MWKVSPKNKKPSTKPETLGLIKKIKKAIEPSSTAFFMLFAVFRVADPRLEYLGIWRRQIQRRLDSLADPL